MKITKTLNPLHFEDLEPHRFEDLVRQLIYDFKDWEVLEATGRSGADEGYDVRGQERRVPSEENEEEATSSEEERKTWLIQCKREKRIGPADIVQCIDEIKTKEKVYGIIFVGACDFSKKTRDAFYNKIREKGLTEGHIWGKAELEDVLFQPKNDHLLFAYFGISLTIQKRSAKTFLNSILTTKRKLVRIFGEIENPKRHNVLLRDVNDKVYPYKGELKDFKNQPPWVLRTFVEYSHDGIVILVKEFYAYSDNKTEEWDYYEKDFSRGINGEDPWEDNPEDRGRRPDRLINDYWYYKIPEANRAWLRVYALVPFDRIIAVDEMGDSITNKYGQVCPHLYVTFRPEHGPYDDWRTHVIEPIGRFGVQEYKPKEEKRIKYFPDTIPEVTPEEREKYSKELSGH